MVHGTSFQRAQGHSKSRIRESIRRFWTCQKKLDLRRYVVSTHYLLLKRRYSVDEMLVSASPLASRDLRRITQPLCWIKFLKNINFVYEFFREVLAIDILNLRQTERHRITFI